MREQIRWTDNHMPPSGDRQLEIMSLANVAKARFFHSSFPQYSVTPWPGWTAWPATWGWPGCL